MNWGDTIAAISSGTGPAARMIVRASGPAAGEIHRRLTGSESFVAGARRCALSFKSLDVPAWVYLFKKPHSATGEDVVEFHLPGNPLLARMLLEEMVRLGSRQAEAGEFTARAYFSGKMGLSEAEGVAAVISAHSERELAAARQLMAGELARRLRPVLDELAQTLALVEAGIDFSEEDISFLTQQEISRRIQSADATLKDLLAGSARFERLTHEPRIVLAGRPNAGKSTLLNALAAEDRAIVSPQAGTTRDALWAAVRLERGIVRLIDVAGIDDSSADDEIGKSMQGQAGRAIEEADVVLLVRDCTDERPVVDLSRAADLCVVTKIDLRSHAASEKEICVSAKTGTNLDRLCKRLDELAFGGHDAGTALALNSRHVQAIEECLDALNRAHGIAADESPETLAMELRTALDSLGQVLGSVTPDDVLGRIFSTFCVGK